MADERSEKTESRSIEIHSFGRIFRVPHAIHTIDRWTLPFPVPLGAAAWAIGAFVAMALLGSAPGIGAVVGVMPWPLRLFVLPGLIGYAASRPLVDGRPLGSILLSLVRHLFSARTIHPAQRRLERPQDSELDHRQISFTVFVPDLKERL